MTQADDLPSDDSVRAVLDKVAPDYTAFSIHALAGSFSNHTHRVNIDFSNSPSQQIVLRQYNEANGDCAGKARREFHTLHALQSHDVPIPKPLYLDDDGTLLGSPGIVTAFVPGTQLLAAEKTQEWASKVDVVAQMLAQIHDTPYADIDHNLLMNANVEVAWFTKSDVVPKFMSAHPDGAMVWETVRDVLPRRQQVEPKLVHVDYWSGNILWHDDRLSAIVDWEEAAYGDPVIDVAYCRMEYYLEGLDDAADRFLQVYEAESGRPVANLGLWELAASARPMIDPNSWFTRPMMADRFRRFIANAKQRILD